MCEPQPIGQRVTETTRFLLGDPRPPHESIFERYLAECLVEIGMYSDGDYYISYLGKNEIIFDSYDTKNEETMLIINYSPTRPIRGGVGCELFIRSFFKIDTRETILKAFKLSINGYKPFGKPKIKGSRMKVSSVFNEYYKLKIYVPMQCYKHLKEIFEDYELKKEEYLKNKSQDDIQRIAKIKKSVFEDKC